jgi:23S rRNA pseudouridine2605 synthase
LKHDRIEVDGLVARATARVYLMLNKPRGLVTTTSDEKGRPTVYQCLTGLESPVPPTNQPRLDNPRGAVSFPRVSPVGRLDQASEGLLLFTNDTQWAAHIAAPQSNLDKVYHVQIDRLADETLIRRLTAGVSVDGERLATKQARLLKSGARNSWIEVVLDEGRNRHIRHLLAALSVEVLRLIRIRIGQLELGALAKGQWRHLTREEVAALTSPEAKRFQSERATAKQSKR